MHSTGRFTTVASGIGFTEGPVWTTGGELLVTSMSRGLVYSVSLEPTRDAEPRPPLGEVETGGGPNGLAEGPGGLVYVAQNGAATGPSRSTRPVAPGLQVLEGTSARDLVVGGLTAPNDLVVGPDQRVWFTDPDGAEPRTTGGRVCTYDPANGAVEVQVTDVDFPNGLAFGLDPDELYIADTTADAILRYRVVDGRPTGRTVFAHVPGSGPDGIAFDAHGNLYIAAFASDEVVVLDPSGAVRRRISPGEGCRPTNLCFAGPGLSTLVVTLARGGRVVTLDEPVAGWHSRPWQV